jgi:hypothetical protein
MNGYVKNGCKTPHGINFAISIRQDIGINKKKSSCKCDEYTHGLEGLEISTSLN